MDYFNKVTGSAMSLAKQSMQAISLGLTVQEEAAQDQVVESPHRVLESNFHAAGDLIEYLAGLPDSKSADGDMRLQQSKVKYYLKEVVAILEDESNNWCKRSSSHPFDVDGSPGTPCMDTFLQSRMVQELCNRAVLDNPRGCLPLILSILASLLQNVSYPLLPHMTVHKPVANLISVAVRYDAMHMYTNAIDPADINCVHSDVFNQEEYNNYKRRIEIGLVGLLRVLWRKFSENPATLDYFTFEDRRKRIDSNSHSPVIRRNSSTGTPNSALVIQTQMDVLNALVNMIHKPRVTRYAQEALLVALNICDKRIDRFITNHTKMTEQIVNDLCKCFHLALDSANEALEAPISLYCGTSSSSINSNSSNINSRSPAQQTINNVAQTPAERRSSSTVGLPNTPNNTNNNANISKNNTGGIATPGSGTGSGTSSSLLSPLHKLSSFRLGKSNPQTFNSPTTTAAAAFAFAKGALYGNNNNNSNTNNSNNNNIVEADQIAQQICPRTEERISPMQNFLRTVRFCVAVAAGLRRMVPTVGSSSYDEEAQMEVEDSSYSYFVECFVGRFLQESLHTALQSRGEGCAVAMNMLLRSMLEEMFDAEKLWAVHSGVSTTYSTSYSSPKSVNATAGRTTRSLLYFTTQFLCGSLPMYKNDDEVPIVNLDPFGTPKPNQSALSAAGSQMQVDYTAMMLNRVGFITRMISVSSYLVLSAVLQCAPLSLALQVLLRSTSTGAGTHTGSSNSIPASPAAVSASASPASSVVLVTKKYRHLDEALSSICATLTVMSHYTLAEDLANASAGASTGVSAPPGSAATSAVSISTDTPSRHATTTKSAAAATVPSGSLNMHRYVELSAQNILSRLPGKALWSLLSYDPEQSALSQALIASLRESAQLEVKSGVIEVLKRRLSSFLIMKYDEQVAFSGLLQRAVCLLCVVVLASPTGDAQAPEAADTAVYFLLQIMEFLQQIEKLWKEIQGYLPRIAGASLKVPAMRKVLQAAAQTEIENSIYFSITNESIEQDCTNSNPPSPHVTGIAGLVDGKVRIVQRVDAASWKLLEKEGAQAKSILESAVLLHEVRAEVRSYVLAVHAIRGMLRDTTGPVSTGATVSAVSRMSGRYGSIKISATSAETAEAADMSEEELCDVPEEMEEDKYVAMMTRLTMHAYGWRAPDYKGSAFDPRSFTPAPPNSVLALSLAAASAGNSKQIAPISSQMDLRASLPTTTATTPAPSTAPSTATSTTLPYTYTRRVLLLSNLDSRQSEFLAEFEALEKGLEDIVGPEMCDVA